MQALPNRIDQNNVDEFGKKSLIFFIECIYQLYDRSNIFRICIAEGNALEL